jgi:hypothetical protein
MHCGMRLYAANVCSAASWCSAFHTAGWAWHRGHHGARRVGGIHGCSGQRRCYSVMERIVNLSSTSATGAPAVMQHRMGSGWLHSRIRFPKLVCFVGSWFVLCVAATSSVSLGKLTLGWLIADGNLRGPPDCGAARPAVGPSVAMHIMSASKLSAACLWVFDGSMSSCTYSAASEFHALHKAMGHQKLVFAAVHHTVVGCLVWCVLLLAKW